MNEPVWSTASGSLGTFYGSSIVNYQLVATATPPATSVLFGLIEGSLPPGLFITSNGLITGTTVSVENTIQYTFLIRATDNLGNSSDRSFTITLVVAQPVWNTAAGNLGGLSSGMEMLPIQLVATPIAPATTITYSLLGNSFPNGITLSASGLISGTPEPVYENTTYTFAIRATDNLNNVKDRTFSLFVSGMNAPEFTDPDGIILSTLDSTWIEHQVNYSSPISTTPVLIRLTQGQLPPGLEINETGLIRGYPKPPYIIADVGEITTASISIINNTIVCYSTRGFSTGRPVLFSGITIGGLNANQTYYVHSIIDENTFTVSYTVGGSAVPLTNATGYMVITLPNVSSGQPTIKTYNFTLTLDSEYGSSVGTYAITVINQNAPSTIGGPGFLPNTRQPTILNTRPIEYDISGDPLIYSYYALPYSSSGKTYPVTTPAYIGKYNSDDEFSFKLLGYDFDNSVIDYDVIGLPTGLTVDINTGWITGTPIIANKSISEFSFKAASRKKSNPSIKSPFFEFTFILTNGIDGQITWDSPSSLGKILNGTNSLLSVSASSQVPLQYELVSGNLPPNLSLLSDGNIAGTVAFQPGTELRAAGQSANYTFTVRAFSPQYPIVKSQKTFTVTVYQQFASPLDTLYIKCTPSIEDRQLINLLLTDKTLIPDEYLFRAEDPNFGKASNVIYTHAYGINSSTFDEYIQSVMQNHYWRNITLGEIKTAVARNQYTGEVVYEVVYSYVYDNLINEYGKSVAKEIIWPRPIPIPSGTTSIVYPNSLDNMRQQIVDELGQDQTTDIFPLWMTSQQDSGSSLGFVPAWVICYTKPGYSEIVKTNITQNWKTVLGDNLALNLINFKIDRFSVSKNLSYNYNPTTDTWSSLPSAPPFTSETVDSDANDFYVWFPQTTILPE